MSKTKVFVDGQEGTTGLKIHERLAVRNDIELLRIDPPLRKDREARRELLNAADIAFLCLPDDAARESVSLLDKGGETRVIDASVAHRTAPGWDYGIPELSPTIRERIVNSRRVAVAGCHASGFVMLLAPLVARGIVPEDFPATCFSLTGYTGGGKKMIAQYEADDANPALVGARPYALSLWHKHLTEMRHWTGLTAEPVFNPVVGNFAQGMIVSIPFHARQLPGAVTADDLHEVLSTHYADAAFVRVMPRDNDVVLDNGFLDPLACNETNRIDLFVFGDEERIVLSSRLDNLGKGASGAAVQCFNLMIGAPETTGLTTAT